MTIIDHHSTLEVRSGFEPEYFVLIQVVPFFIDSFVQWKIVHKDHQVNIDLFSFIGPRATVQTNWPILANILVQNFSDWVA